MSNGLNWSSWINDDAGILRRYLQLQHYPGSTPRVNLGALLRDTDFGQPPTDSWYALHQCTDGKKWTAQIIAWGLNVSEKDLVKLQLELMPIWTSNSKRLFQRAENPEEQVYCARNKDRRNADYVLDDIYGVIEKEIFGLSPRFHDLVVPRWWKLQAIHQFGIRYRTTARKWIENGEFKMLTGEITTKGREKWRPVLGQNNATNILLPYDVVGRVLDFIPLKPYTMRAFAKSQGLDRTEQDRLVKEQCNPRRLLSKLVLNPEELLYVMSDCGVILSGSRAASYFYPDAATRDSDWDFFVHPKIHNWLKFAMYLRTIGVQWSSDSQKLNTEHEPGIYGYIGSVLVGYLEHAGRRNKIQLVAHGISDQSSVVAVMHFHSTIVQCFISGFAAVCMYPYLTSSGCSRIWLPRWPCDSILATGAQNAVGKFVERGIRYINPRVELKTSVVPSITTRSLGDDETLRIPFEPYLSSLPRQSLARSSMKQLQQFYWQESAYIIKPSMGPFCREPDDQNYDTIPIPHYDQLMEAFSCHDCVPQEDLYCATHQACVGDSVGNESLIDFFLRINGKTASVTQEYHFI